MTASMITTNRAGPTGKTVLLFSGGMDSLCFDLLLKPDYLLYVPTGAAYEDVETGRLFALCDAGYIERDKLIVLSGVLNLAAYERDDAIVPNRNAHLVLLASHYGERIFLSSVSGDRSTDKDAQFFESIGGLLDHMWSAQHWTAARRFAVSSPFKHLTKTQLVARFLRAGGAAEALLLSYSCYDTTGQACGVCKPCARKRVALENNGIIQPGYFAAPFWETEWFATLRPEIMQSSYRGAEDVDFASFLSNRTNREVIEKAARPMFNVGTDG